MRWSLTTESGRAVGSAKTVKGRDAQAWSYIAHSQHSATEPVPVLATDTRTGRVVRLSAKLRRQTITKARGK